MVIFGFVPEFVSSIAPLKMLVNHKFKFFKNFIFVTLQHYFMKIPIIFVNIKIKC